MSPKSLEILVVVWTIFLVAPAMADGNLPTKFSNIGSIGNTRHNLTQRQASGGGPAGVTMDQYRNDYGEVCVYCHTPHGANSAPAAPLWNRVLPTAADFNTYNSGTLTQAATAPGANSLVCLSCHDGQTAVDSVYNMPGSGRYSATPNNAFLQTWAPNPSGVGPGGHMAMDNAGCLACHASTAGFVGAGATDFSAFVIGTDLRDDHPIGVAFPGGTPATTGFNNSTLTQGSVTFYDRDGNGKLGKGDLRFYDTGGGPEVECGSCHDPHGVPSGAAGSQFIPSFLRASNSGSGLCLTCHAK